MTDTEAKRRADFFAVPILADYLACMLQDLQYSEADESCTDEREARDTGTIYTLREETYQRCKSGCERFMVDCREAIEAATALEPGEPGLRYARGRYMTLERIGSTLWLARTGSGVTFTDDGDAPCLVAMADWARANPLECAYFGDDGAVYLT